MVCEYLEGIKDEETKEKMMKEFEANEQKITIQPAEGKEFELTKDHISFQQSEHTKMEEKFTPHVIEPSFGIGRIIYCIFEHCFKVREEDAQRTFFDFPPHIAPLKCSLLPLMSNPDMNKKVQEIKRKLIKEGVTSKVDDSGQSVGKRYARTDECGIPFAITVDFDTLNDDTVTVRDLDSMKQVRMHSDDVAQTLIDLTNSKLKWAQVVEKYGLFTAAETK